MTTHPAANTLVPATSNTVLTPTVISNVCKDCKSVKHCTFKGPDVKSCELKHRVQSFGN